MDSLCGIFKGFDDILVVKPNNSELNSDKFPTLNDYCPLVNNGNEQKCNSYEELITSAFLTLLLNYISNFDGGNLENDKHVQYIILWLCYKLNKRSENGTTNLNYVHNKYINDIEKYIMKSSGVKAYNSYKAIIKKEDIMTMNINDMSKLYEALNILCKLYTECSKNNQNCAKCLKDAEEFVKSFGALNKDSNNTVDSSYSQILSTLSKDYEILKNKCTNFPPLPQLTPQKRSVQNFAHNSDVTTSSSSIASTLIPVLLTFAIPFFLGIAYKYSLFGFDKQLQRQYLREKLKKIKKKMNHYM
ncbi:Plasmodium variant antigen protein Cir/Yir/Bir, putative [Plasmodium chabaudi adami]|uniref:Plasmodium variant antigen protein Cir/Yir/Bir, putative n=1 Tax=Plasmodium chabaudi adami TaxID=5826 RepID=A0A1D3LAJ1_PLACE|nr:Plasmodium variant antigen protein Cir/Yir/Bir, putative [Plasmodium chabaudi adami]